MLSIPRTHSLRLNNFPAKIEYEGRKFTPIIDEYAVIGQMQSQDYDILDLEPALNDFLTDHDCCVLLGPQIMALWIEDGVYYMFDPNGRDQEGRAMINEGVTGVACVLCCRNLKDLVDIYVANTEKALRAERFYLSQVDVEDYVDVSEDWYNFKGIDLGIWVIRGSFNQASVRFSPESRNLQGTANALIALGVAAMFDEREWSNDTVDEVTSLILKRETDPKER